MKLKHFTEQQIVGFLKEAEAGLLVKEQCRESCFNDAIFLGCPATFDGLRVSGAVAGVGVRERDAQEAARRGAPGCGSAKCCTHGNLSNLASLGFANHRQVTLKGQVGSVAQCNAQL